MKIFYRVCEKQATITNEYTRWNDSTKTEIIKKSWLSLQNSISREDQLFVFYDQVGPDIQEFIGQTAKSLLTEIDVPSHKWEEHLHTRIAIDMLKRELENSNDDEWIFMVEDDYLFTEDALDIIRETQKYWGGFIAPHDDKHNYTNPSNARVLIGPDRHWRTVSECTFTLSARASTWAKYTEELTKAAPSSDDGIFSEIFSTDACICPTPAVATHLTEESMSPMVPWIKIWDEIDVSKY